MMRLIELSGTPAEMGEAHGTQLSEQVRGLIDERIRLACVFAREHGVRVRREDCIQIASESLASHREYSGPVFEELEGIARGAGVSTEEVLFTNGLTDFQDVLWQTSSATIAVHGCTSFLLGPEATVNGAAMIGQTWDMHASAEQFIAVFSRRPDDGPGSITMTTAGCLSLVGVNEAGIAIGNNNLRPEDARRGGVMYLAMIHNCLRQQSWSDAVSAITKAVRSSGHNYYLAHESGLRIDIETTAAQHQEIPVDQPTYVHTNHYLTEKLAKVEERDLDRGSSEHRLARMRRRLEDWPSPLTAIDVCKCMSDHDGDDLAICRHGTGRETRSCAFVAVEPAARRLHVSLGPPCAAELNEYELA